MQANARLTPMGRLTLVMRIASGRPVAESSRRQRAKRVALARTSGQGHASGVHRPRPQQQAVKRPGGGVGIHRGLGGGQGGVRFPVGASA